MTLSEEGVFDDTLVFDFDDGGRALWCSGERSNGRFLGLGGTVKNPRNVDCCAVFGTTFSFSCSSSLDVRDTCMIGSIGSDDACGVKSGDEGGDDSKIMLDVDVVSGRALP